MRKKRGKHMSYPPKFEDIGAWHLARDLTRKVNERKIERKKMNIEHRTGKNEETKV